MASLRAIRTRIKSVKGTQKITKAMKLVAAAKLRRAQDAVVRARPYAGALERMLGTLAEGARSSEQTLHPLLAERPARRIEVLVVTSDRGLAGGFNANVVRRLNRFLNEECGEFDHVTLSTVGRRGRDFIRKRGAELRHDYAGVVGKLSVDKARHISSDLAERFLRGDVDRVYVLYNRFQSALVQNVTLTRLLPIVAPAGATEAASEPVYEPAADAVLDELLPRHLSTQVWRALLESEASEHGARMTAMDNATKNAKDMIGRLTLQYNRARQAAITKELMEIVSGAEALR